MKFKRDDFAKAIKWYFMTIFVVLGTMCFFMASEHDNIRPVWVGIISFGIVFIILSVWKTIRNKILLTTFTLIVGLSFVAKYLPFYLFKHTGYYLDLDYYLLWMGLIFVVGVPVMTIGFDKLADD